MDPITIAALIGGGTALAGSLLGNDQAKDAEKARMELLERARDEYGNIDLPKLERLVAEQLGPSELTKLQDDPELRNIERQTLAELKRVYEGGGRTLQEKANLQADMGRASHQNRANQEHIRDEMNARGTMGGGSELLMRLKSSADAAGRNSQSALQSAASAESRASQALMQRGQLAGQMGNADYARKARAAEAQDAIARANAAARAQAAQYNAGLAQQQFGNQMQLASGKANALGNQANAVQDNSQRTRDFFGGMGQVAMGAGSAMQSQRNYDEWLKRQSTGGMGASPYGNYDDWMAR